MQGRTERQFLDIQQPFSDFESSAVVLLPIPYEGGVSYGKGTGRAPSAVIESSAYLELYDEVLDAEPYRMGICTLAPPSLGKSHEDMFEAVYQSTVDLLAAGKFVVVIGGDHSISSGYFKALSEHSADLAAIQLDAHSDLRDTYEGSPLSHACVMSRIREMTEHTLQIGIRSISVEEAERVRIEGLRLCTMHEFRGGTFDLDGALKQLPDNVFITLDVDGLDWSVVRSTGTPEPGGFLWDEALALLEKIFDRKNVVGFDVVELSSRADDSNSVFAVAKLIYKMLGFKLRAWTRRTGRPWPVKPEGVLFWSF